MNVNIKKTLRGTGVALVTPFDKNNKIDFIALERLIEHVIKGGVEYVVVNGTTGESVVLSKQEKTEILSFVIGKIDGRVPIVYGIGGNNTDEVLSVMRQTNLSQIDAILSVCPYYNKPSQIGIYEHYKQIALNSSIPVILYNVPGRTVVNILPETTLKLANDFENIIGIKEATDNLDQIMQIIKEKPEGFLVIGGDDALGLPLLACGIDGVISVISNAYPHLYASLVREGLKDNFNLARNYHYQLLPIMEMLLTVNNPAGIKAVLSIMQIIDNHLRLPLVPIDEDKYQAIQQLIKSI